MNKLKKCAIRFMDLLEVYIPMFLFFAVFILYLVMISKRYLFYSKVGKDFELCQIAFVWCSIMSASYGGRTGQHICFGLLYDRCSEKIQRVLRIVGNLITEVMLLIIFPYAFEAIDFLKIKKSDLLRIPFNLIYAPFLVFLILTFIHYGYQLYKDFRKPSKQEKEEKNP